MASRVVQRGPTVDDESVCVVVVVVVVGRRCGCVRDQGIQVVEANRLFKKTDAVTRLRTN